MQLNDYIKLLHPWTFTVDVGDVLHAIKRPNVAAVVTIDAAREGLTTAERILEFVRHIFVKPPADMDDWDPALLAVVAREYCTAVGEYLRKNRQTLLSTTTTAAVRPSAD